MNISNEGIMFICEREGFEEYSYKDTVGIWTIGYGTTTYMDGRKVQEGEQITTSQAAKEMGAHLGTMIRGLEELVDGIPLRQPQFDALCSLVYNIGIGAFGKSTVLRLVRKDPNDPSIANAFMMWNKETRGGKKVVSDGLTNRREMEITLYFS